MTDRPETTLDCAAPDAGFMACPTCQADEFAVVCRGVPDAPRIVALVCATCDTEIPVEDGAPRAAARTTQ
jgi:uncharacterized protein YbaR (Trm112 family)